MRLVRCGLFVLAFVIGIQLFCVCLWRNAYLSVAAMFSHHTVSRRIDYLGRIKTRRLYGFGRTSRHCRLLGHDCRVSAWHAATF